jgi:hypothetical protein
MLTVTVLATPNLGNSFTKAFQRIVGVLIGKQTCDSGWHMSRNVQAVTCSLSVRSIQTTDTQPFIQCCASCSCSWLHIYQGASHIVWFVPALSSIQPSQCCCPSGGVHVAVYSPLAVYMSDKVPHTCWVVPVHSNLDTVQKQPSSCCCPPGVVPAGGWLFYGLYAACQEWWFLVICLSVWAFILVALSFWLTGREFMFPVALVTAFIGKYPVLWYRAGPWNFMLAMSYVNQNYILGVGLLRYTCKAVQWASVHCHAADVLLFCLCVCCQLSATLTVSSRP